MRSVIAAVSGSTLASPAVLTGLMPLLSWAEATAAATQPNIVLILADDLGFTDIAPYGSEIHTPTLSALAETGIRFSNYHTAGSCAPARAMLLTGVDSHRNGVPNISEALPPERRHHPDYEGVLSRNVVTVATLLQDSGLPQQIGIPNWEPAQCPSTSDERMHVAGLRGARARASGATETGVVFSGRGEGAASASATWGTMGYG